MPRRPRSVNSRKTTLTSLFGSVVYERAFYCACEADVAGLLSLPEVGRQLRRECQSVGVANADVAVALTDGEQGLEDCLLNALGGVAQEIVFVLDFYHASEHIHA